MKRQREEKFMGVLTNIFKLNLTSSCIHGIVIFMKPLLPGTETYEKINPVPPVRKSPSQKRKILMLILVLLLIIPVFILIMTGLVKGKIPMIGNILQDIIKLRSVSKRDDLEVRKKINAKDGGTVSVKSPSGLTYTLYIPPGSLKSDTEISLTLLSGSPLVDMTGSDPGVNVGPDGTVFDPPGTIAIGNQPGGQPGGGIPGGQLPGSGGNTSGPGGTTGPQGGSGPAGGSRSQVGITLIPKRPPADMEVITPGVSGLSKYGGMDLGAVMQQYGVKLPEIPQTGNQGTIPEVEEPAESHFDDNILVVFDGRSGVKVPPVNKVKGGVIVIRVSGSGNVVPVNPDKAAAKTAVRQAAANAEASGGGCTDEYMSAVERFINLGGTSDEISQINGNILKRCRDEKLTQLTKQCQTDRVLVKRRQFTSLIKILEAVSDDEGVGKAEKVMSECEGKLEFETVDSVGTIVTTTSANVCGFVDDLWNAKATTVMTSGADTVFTLEGQGTFSLPAFGGQWGCRMTGRYQVVSLSMGMPYAAVGTFDGLKGVRVASPYQQDQFRDAIITMKGSCISAPALQVPGSNSSGKKTGSQDSVSDKKVPITDAPPIKPLPGNEDTDLPPLEPLPQGGAAGNTDNDNLYIPPKGIIDDEGLIPLRPLIQNSK
jgi:hypothetical protein